MEALTPSIVIDSTAPSSSIIPVNISVPRG
jgi:hypothetical protein